MELNDGGCLPLVKGGTEYEVSMLNGSPGTIPLLTAAAGMFPDLEEALIACAIKAGERTWTEGFVLQGNGLASGITGNGYAM